MAYKLLHKIKGNTKKPLVWAGDVQLAQSEK